LIRHLDEVENFSNQDSVELKAFCFPWQKAKVFIRN
jgi:hypothetical protein